MRIFVDADACPVVRIIEKLAKKHDISCMLLCDTNHLLQSDYSQVVVVDAGADAVDFKLIGFCQSGDIVCTQDYGVAAMALGKNCYVIHQSGRWFTNECVLMDFWGIFLFANVCGQHRKRLKVQQQV